MMWIIFSLFLHFSIFNCSHNDKSFLVIPNMPGFHWTKVVWALATLQQHTTGVTTATTMAPANRNGPLAAHMRPLRSAPTHLMAGWQPPQLADITFGGVKGVYGPQSTPLFWQLCITITSECFVGHIHPQHPPKLHPLAWGVVVHPLDASAQSARASCEVLGGHFCWLWPWLAMVVLVVVGRCGG